MHPAPLGSRRRTSPNPRWRLVAAAVVAVLLANGARVATAGAGQATSGGSAAGHQAGLNEDKSLVFTPDDFTVMPFDGGFSGYRQPVSGTGPFRG